MSQNLLYLHDLQSASWLQLSRTNQLLNQASHQPLADVPFKQATTVLLPNTDVTLLSTLIPSHQRQRIVQALPYALEEQLATDVDSLHFAVGMQNKTSQQVTAAVISHTRFQAYLDVVQQAGVHAHQFVPDVLAVPLPETGWGLWISDDKALVRSATQQGFGCETTQLTVWLQAAMEDESPAQLVLYRGNEPINLTALHALGIPIVEQVHTDSALAWLAQGLDTQRLNLLQGNYRPQQGQLVQQLWQWRWTALLLLLWGAWSLGQVWWETLQLQEQRQTLNHAINAIYKQTYPQTRRIVNARVQMQQKLNALHAQVSQPAQTTGFLPAFLRLAPVFQQIKEFDIQTIQYRQSQFDLRVQLPNLQVLTRLKQQLQQQQFEVEIQSAQSQNNRVDAHLRLKPMT